MEHFESENQFEIPVIAIQRVSESWSPQPPEPTLIFYHPCLPFSQYFYSTRFVLGSFHDVLLLFSLSRADLPTWRIWQPEERRRRTSISGVRRPLIDTSPAKTTATTFLYLSSPTPYLALCAALFLLSFVAIVVTWHNCGSSLNGSYRMQLMLEGCQKVFDSDDEQEERPAVSRFPRPAKRHKPS